MRHFLLTNLFFAAMTINVGVPARCAAVALPSKDIEVADISDKTRLLKTELLGKYIFVHDEEKMARGEPCLYVYRYSQDQAGQPEVRPETLVVSFHCQPVERPKADKLVLTYGMNTNGSFELREIQFSGSLKGHRVP